MTATSAPASADPGAALLEAVARALPDLEALLEHGDVLGAEPTAAVKDTIARGRARLEREAPHVVVVGEQKSGKSTFLNALLGVRLLGTAARECTATVTRLRWGETYGYEARFEDGTVRRFDDLAAPPTADEEEAIAALDKVRAALAANPTPLHELPPAWPFEPAQPAEQREAQVDAYRSLASAQADRDAAREAIPAAYRGQGGWLAKLIALPRWRAAARQLAQEEFRCAEAERGVAQAQRFVIERRIQSLRDVLQNEVQRRHDQFVEAVRDLTDAAGSGSRVVELAITYPGRFLPRGLVLIDTPGVNTENALHRDRAWGVIREDADACWLVSDIQQALSRSTRAFLQDLRPFVGHAFLVLSKVDRALANAEGTGGDAPADQVEEARRIAVKRFAAELDRTPKEVFAVAIAAEQALEAPGSPLGLAFAGATETLLALAKQERAIVLGARAAVAITRASGAIDLATEHGLDTYEERLTRLEAQRIPEPEAFCGEQLAAVVGKLGLRMPAIVADAVLEGKKALARQQTAWQMALLSAMDETALRETAAQAGATEAEAVAAILEKGLARLREGTAIALAELEGPAFEALRTRYRVAQALVGSGSNLPVAAPAPAGLEEPVTLELAAGLDDALVAYATDRLQLGVGGAAAGAAIGSMVMPGVGTVVGALVGSLAAFFISLDDLKADCVKQLDERVQAVEPRMVQALEDAGTAIQDGLLATFGRSLLDALGRFQAWIDELLAAERATIAQLQSRLDDLASRQAALRDHADALDALMRAAEESSRGLARAQDAPASARVRLSLPRARRGTSPSGPGT